ncbi:MAG: hypothetical protein RL227_1254 [Pseudomonadota bacterium]
MKLKQLAMAAVIAVGSVSTAYAQDITQSIALVPNATVAGAFSAGWGATHQLAGAFTDTFTLTGATGGLFESVLANIGSMASSNFDFTSVSINGNAFTISDAGPVHLASFALGEVSGPLQLVVSGIAGDGLSQGTGIAASYGAMANVSPVPELETLAMMLAGLGVVGTAGRRRMNKG